MAKKIIVLEHLSWPSDLNYRIVFWLDVPAARQSLYANPAATSAFKNATTQELAALTSGAVVEQVISVFYPAGTALSPTITNDLAARWNAAQATLNAQNPYDRYGTSWDGTTWTPVTVA